MDGGARTCVRLCVGRGYLCVVLCLSVCGTRGGATPWERGAVGLCCTRGAGQGAAVVWSGDGVLDRLATPLQTGRILASSTAKGALSLSCVLS